MSFTYNSTNVQSWPEPNDTETIEQYGARVNADAAYAKTTTNSPTGSSASTTVNRLKTSDKQFKADIKYIQN